MSGVEANVDVTCTVDVTTGDVSCTVGVSVDLEKDGAGSGGEGSGENIPFYQIPGFEQGRLPN